MIETLLIYAVGMVIGFVVARLVFIDKLKRERLRVDALEGVHKGVMEHVKELDAAFEGMQQQARIAEGQARNYKHEYDTVKGLWATDRPNLIKNVHLRQLFFRIGYPKEKL